MARIKEWLDLSELGDIASYTAAGWSLGSNGRGTVGPVTSPVYHDALGNGGLYSFESVRRQQQWSPPLASPLSTFYLRIHFQSTIWGTGSPSQQGWILHWNKGANFVGGIKMDASTGQLQLWSGDTSGTLLATSTNVLAINTWYLLEVGITIGNVGAYEVRVNGTSVGWIPAAVGDTQPGADTTVDTLYPCDMAPTDEGPWVMYFDDLSADSAGFIGESLVTALHPSGDGTTIELTGVPLINWRNVKEIPPLDSDYNFTLVANKKDTYVHGSLPGSASTVKCLLVVARAVRVGSGSVIDTIYLVTRSAGTDYEAPGKLLSPVTSIFTNLWEVDPATSAAWTVTALNASEFGARFDT